MVEAADAGEKFLSIENIRGYRREVDKLFGVFRGIVKVWKDFQVGVVFSGIARTLVAIQNASLQFRAARFILNRLYGASSAPQQLRTVPVGSTPAVSGIGAAQFQNAQFLSVIEQSVRSIDQQIKSLDKV